MGEKPFFFLKPFREDPLRGGAGFSRGSPWKMPFSRRGGEGTVFLPFP